MHTIEFDSATEQALARLAASHGQSPDEWLKETLVKLINSQSQVLPSMAEFRAGLPMQAVSAGEFCRDMRDEERSETSALPPLASLIGKGQGCFQDAAEVDAFLRSERDSWEG
jgi:hypothetical protein